MAKTKKKPKTTKKGTVHKLIKSSVPGIPEKAEIVVHDADELYREIRIDNTLENAKGKKVRMKQDADVDVTVEAEEKDTTPKPT